MKLNSIATAILTALVLAAIVALTAAHLPVPPELSLAAAGLIGGHLALAVPGGGTVSVTTTPSTVSKEIATAEPTIESVIKTAESAASASTVTP